MQGGASAIINISDVSGRLFALGLDTVEIAGALALKESVVTDALRDAVTAQRSDQGGEAD